jgi:hypothetical protein
VAVLIVVLVGIYFLFGWITPGLFAWVSSFSIVQPLTIALVVVAVVLGGGLHLAASNAEGDLIDPALPD